MQVHVLTSKRADRHTHRLSQHVHAPRTFSEIDETANLTVTALLSLADFLVAPHPTVIIYANT